MINFNLTVLFGCSELLPYSKQAKLCLCPLYFKYISGILVKIVIFLSFNMHSKHFVGLYSNVTQAVTVTHGVTLVSDYLQPLCLKCSSVKDDMV